MFYDVNDNLDKLLKMMTTLLQKATDNQDEYLSKYREYATELDRNSYNKLIDRIKNYEMCSYTLSEEYEELDAIEKEYERLKEKQYDYLLTYNKYGNSTLELKPLNMILIDKISKRKEDVLGKLNCDKEIDKCKKELDNLSIRLSDEEKKKVANKEIICKLEKQLKDDFFRAEGRLSSRIDGSNYTSVKSEYRLNGYDIEELLNDKNKLNDVFSKAIENKNDKEGFEKAGIISYDVIPTKENKELLDEYHMETVRAKYQLTLVKILALVGDELDNYNDVWNKRIKLQDLLKYRLIYLKELGINHLVDPFGRIKLANQMELLEGIVDNSKEIVNITKSMGNVNDRLDQMISDRNRLLKELSDKEKFIVDDLSMSKMASMVEMDDKTNKDVYQDNQVVEIKEKSLKMNSRIVFEKANGVLSRVNKMMNREDEKIEKNSIEVSPDLVISPVLHNEVVNNIPTVNIEENTENKIKEEDLFNVEEMPFNDVMAPLFKDRVLDDNKKSDEYGFLPDLNIDDEVVDSLNSKVEETNKDDNEVNNEMTELSFWPEQDYQENKVDKVQKELSLDEQINSLLSGGDISIKKR